MNTPTSKRAVRNLARHENNNALRKTRAALLAAKIAEKREEKREFLRKLELAKKERKKKCKEIFTKRISSIPYGKDRRNWEMQEAARRLSPHNHEWKDSFSTREEWVKSLNMCDPLMMFASWEEACEVWKEKSSRPSVHNRKPDEKLREVFEMYGEDYPYDGLRSVIHKVSKRVSEYQFVLRVKPGVYLVWIGGFTRRKNPPCAVADYDSIWPALCSLASSAKIMPSMRVRLYFYQRTSISALIKNTTHIKFLSEKQILLLAETNAEKIWRHARMSRDEVLRTCSNEECPSHNIRLIDFSTMTQIQAWIKQQYWGSIHNYMGEDIHPPVRECIMCNKKTAHTTMIDMNVAEEVATSVVKNLDEEIKALEAKEQTEEVVEKLRVARESRKKFLICPCDNGRGGKCGVPMEWNNGCAKMTCVQCGGSFCSRCMTETPRNNPYHHRCSNPHQGDPFFEDADWVVNADALEQGAADERRNA